MKRALCSIVCAAPLCLAILTACDDAAHPLVSVEPENTLRSVMITPVSASMNVADRLTLVATLPSGSDHTNLGIAWTAANSTVATIDANGIVTAIGGGTTTIVATSVAHPTVQGAAAITVFSFFLYPTISAINQDGKPADLSNISGRIDVNVDLSAPTESIPKVELLLSCEGRDTVVATQDAPGTSVVGPLERSTTLVALSFNTAGFKNGPCVVKAQLTTTTGTIVRSAGVPITLNNPTTSASVALLRFELSAPDTAESARSTIARFPST
jgi:hypothetical protein